MSDDPHVLDVDHLATPFTAAEIAAATPVGWWVESVETVGDAVVGRTPTTFVRCDADGADFERVALDDDGRPAGQARTSSATWIGLQLHASFPAETATRSAETVDTPLGRLDCLRYDVVAGDAAMTFWFSVAHPGQPIRYLLESPDGVRVTTVTALGPAPRRPPVGDG